MVRRPNYQNDRIWAKSIKDIEEDERYREMVIKDKGEFWMTGQYCCDIILIENVFPFLKNEENVINPNEVIFVYDKAPCML
ncbi:unnamed protein product, partial [Rotaria sordida]